jgi:hypothetical protein
MLLLRAALVFILAAWVSIRMVGPAFRDSDFFVRCDPEGGLRVQDFASHLRFTRAVWNGLTREAPGSIYTPAAHLQFMQTWTGKPRQVIDRALPFGYSPTMLLVLGPLCPLPEVWAYSIWTGLGLTAVWWMTSPGRPLMLVALLCFLSPLCLDCLALGQTAILSTAALLFLATSNNGGAGRPWKDEWVSALVLWLLTAKPPLAVTAGAGLLACRRWRPVILAGGLTLLSTLALVPLLGGGWAGDYWKLITGYDVEHADPAFAWSLVPSYMSNLRGILFLRVGIADGLASRIGSVAWVVSWIGLVGAGWRWGMCQAKAWSLTVLAFLLLAPHVTYTEDLHLYVLACLPLGVLPVWLMPAAVTGLVWLTPFAPATAVGWRWPLPSFVGKLGLGLIVMRWGRGERRLIQTACHSRLSML